MFSVYQGRKAAASIAMARVARPNRPEVVSEYRCRAHRNKMSPTAAFPSCYSTPDFSVTWGSASEASMC